MPRFSFKAYDAAGRLQLGTVEADSEKAALEALSRDGRYPLDVTPAAAGATPAPSIWTREIGAPRGLSTAAQATLARELATLIRAGLPVDEALRIIALQPRLGARARRVVAVALERVAAGDTLFDALSAEKGALPEHFRWLVRAGETGGSLAQSMDELAQFLELSARARSQITTAMLYPMVLLAAAIVTLVIIATVMVPAIVPLFRDAGIEPPVLVRVLAGFEAVVVGWWPLTLAVLVSLVAAMAWSARSEAGRVLRDRLVLRLPVLGGLARDIATARLARTLATLVRNGVPLLDALRVTAGAVSNRVFRAALRAAEEDVNTGSPLWMALERTGLLPELAARFFKLGEETGQLAPMLTRTADIYDHDVQQRLQRILTIAAPLVTIGIGLGVGALILSVMSAMLGLNEAVLR
jgi:general secretion pathway protein F